MYDCLRANKSMMGWGVEARVPFLDRVFLDYAMNLDPEVKMCPGHSIYIRTVSSKQLFMALVHSIPSWLMHVVLPPKLPKQPINQLSKGDRQTLEPVCCKK